ncbi:MAG: hypothetical protein M1544_00635 [Candidatus Marsarchaeota archaeon]|nr:hypothetical protein [Candidatus Marsarchaeota archaeon]
MGMKNKKAQSAMEYLMTYGWAILIIAIVLAALFSLGIFSSSSFTGTTCIASSGFLCSSPVWTNGNFIASLGQSTGTGWTDVMFFFVPAGVSSPTAALTPPSSGNVLIAATGGNYIVGTSTGFTPGSSSFSSGQTESFTFNLGADGFPTAPGTSTTGTLWVQYTVPSASNLLSQIATTTLKES